MFCYTHTVKHGVMMHDDITGDFVRSEFRHFEGDGPAKRFTMKLIKDFLDGKIKLEYIEVTKDNPKENRLQQILYQFDAKHGFYSIFSKLKDGDIDNIPFTSFQTAFDYYRKLIKESSDQLKYVVFVFSQEASKTDRIMDMDEYWFNDAIPYFIKDRWGYTSDAFMIDQWFNPKYYKEEE